LALFLLCSPPLLRAQEGKLDRVREEVNREEPPADRKEREDNCEDDACGELLAILFGPCILYTLASPFIVPHVLLNDDLHVYGYFPGFPYAGGRPGYLHVGEPVEPPAEPGTWLSGGRLKPWALRLAVEESNDFDGLNRVTGHFLLDTASRFGVQSSWTQLHECTCRGPSDELVLGDVNLVFRFAQHERATFRTGLGFRTLLDGSDSRWGFNFTYGADFYPKKPFILSGQIDAGTLGSAGVFHGRATAGFNWRHVEVYGGYDYLRIGSVDLQGPVMGLRLWF
jgi:hypothetical protein